MNLQQRRLLRLYQRLPQAETLLTRSKDVHWAKLFPWGRGENFKIATPIDALEGGEEWIQDFTKVYGPSLVMPLSLFDKGLGFGARALKQKKFSANLFQIPGFYTASTAIGRPFIYGEPIIVVEGVLDAEVASLAYPWVVATLTAKISEAQAFLLSGLTNLVIFSFDNDEAGDKGMRFSAKYLKKWGIQSVRMPPTKRLKDWGDLLGLPKDEMQAEITRYSMELRTRGIIRL